MKIQNIIIRSFVIGLTGITLSSCNDFLTITPSDKTVLEDYWKSKSDVEEMVTGAYKSMLDEGLIERLIVWGEYRSDEVEKQQTYSNTALDNINAVNLLPSNGYNSWDTFYKVINNCNLVLAHAPEVANIDPDFTESDLEVVRAQMLALRSLCHFYLVRTFRDIPYSDQAFESDNQNLLMAQSAPATVLQKCIDDLIEAEKHIYRYGTFGSGNWKNMGMMNRDAINAILADIYLWRASMTGSQADYQACSDYADKVIASRKTYNGSGQGTVTSDSKSNPYNLVEASSMLYNLFGTGNNENESILEWQFDGNNNSNAAVCKYYYKRDAKSGDAHGRFMASQIYNSVDASANTESGTKAFATLTDYRYWNNIYLANTSDETQFDIRKMVENSPTYVVPSTSGGVIGVSPTSTRPVETYSQNWIAYRLTDVMLMKAEAKVQLAANDDDNATLREAFDLVKAVNDRSLARNSADTLSFSNFSGKSAMELLVLAERGRELCFEGKRWFDLMRYSYRHTTGTDATRTLYEIDPNGTDYPKIYDKMLKIVLRKFTSGGDAVSYKMKNEAYLYFPISETEMKANSLLHQNPVYIEEKSTSKN